MDVFDEYRQAIYCVGCPVRTNRLTYGPRGVTLVEERVAPALAADLGATASALKRLGIRTLLARGAFTIPSFDALTAGTLSATATAQTRPKPATAASARRVTIARARRSFSRAGKYRVKVKLTKQGRRALRRARRVRVRLTLAFTDRSGKTMRKAKTVSLRR